MSHHTLSAAIHVWEVWKVWKVSRKLIIARRVSVTFMLFRVLRDWIYIHENVRSKLVKVVQSLNLNPWIRPAWRYHWNLWSHSSFTSGTYLWREGSLSGKMGLSGQWYVALMQTFVLRTATFPGQDWRAEGAPSPSSSSTGTSVSSGCPSPPPPRCTDLPACNTPRPAGWKQIYEYFFSNSDQSQHNISQVLKAHKIRPELVNGKWTGLIRCLIFSPHVN